MEDLRLYDKDVKCPLCHHSFTTKKTRNRRLKVKKRHEDFYVEYEGVNPIYYHVWICPKCGYSATESQFDNMQKQEEELLKEKLSSKWQERDYGGERSSAEAETAYKLALYVGMNLDKSKGYLGSLCLKLAWIYRERRDPREKEFLEKALNAFEEAYETEAMPIDTIEEVPMTYLIGELHRQLGNYSKAIQWYSRVVEHPEIKFHRQILLKAREQWALAKEEYNKKRKGL